MQDKHCLILGINSYFNHDPCWISSCKELEGDLMVLIDLKTDSCAICRGQVRFYKRSPNSCGVSLSVSYELPDILAPFVGVSIFFLVLLLDFCACLHLLWTAGQY